MGGLSEQFDWMWDWTREADDIKNIKNWGQILMTPHGIGGQEGTRRKGGRESCGMK